MSTEEWNECPVSTQEFKLHDWRWLGWPLSDPASSGRWCRACGMVQGKPVGRCRTTNCLEYAAGGNDFCEACQHKRAINAAATRMREACVAAGKQSVFAEAVRLGISAERAIALSAKVEVTLSSLTLD